MPFQLGKLAPHPEDTHPRVKLASHLPGPAGIIPAVVDWATEVKAWPLLLNDRLGDCTAAGAFHMFQAMRAYAGEPFTPADAEALALYEAVSGYNPQTGANDNGAVEQDVLQYLVDHGADSHRAVAFAQVDHLSAAEMKTALAMFGSVYVGIQCPQSMQQQFEAGEPIDYVPGSPVEGGHCVVIQKWDADYLWIVTWGQLVRMTWAFWEAMGDEAWVVVTADWLEANGTSPSGLNLAGLLSEFHEITGSAAPTPLYAVPEPGALKRAWNWLRLFLHDL